MHFSCDFKCSGDQISLLWKGTDRRGDWFLCKDVLVSLHFPDWCCIKVLTSVLLLSACWPGFSSDFFFFFFGGMSFLGTSPEGSRRSRSCPCSRLLCADQVQQYVQVFRNMKTVKRTKHTMGSQHLLLYWTRLHLQNIFFVQWEFGQNNLCELHRDNSPLREVS